MTNSPLSLTVLFHVGPVPITAPVAVTWGIMALLAGGSRLLTRRLALRPPAAQAVLELVVDTIAAQIRDTMAGTPGVQDAGIFQETGQPELLVTVDRAASARYGLAGADVNAAVQAAVGGQA